MQNKELENAILILKNYCNNHSCDDCDMVRTCEEINSNSLPCDWEIKD